MYEFDNFGVEHSHLSPSTFDDRRKEFDASFRTFSIVSIVIGTFFGIIFILVFCYIVNRIIRMHSNPSEASARANRIRTWVPVNNTENTTGTVATAPATPSFTPDRNNRQYLPLDNVRVDQYPRPIGFDVGIDLDRSSRSPQDNRSFSLNNVRVDQYGRPIGFDVGIDFDRSFRSAQENRSFSFNNVRLDQYGRPIGFDAGIDLDRSPRSAEGNRSFPRMGDVQLLSSDKPPAYGTVVSGDTFPSVSLKVPAESSLPSYEERSICKR